MGRYYDFWGLTPSGYNGRVVGIEENMKRRSATKVGKIDEVVDKRFSVEFFIDSPSRITYHWKHASLISATDRKVHFVAKNGKDVIVCGGIVILAQE